MQQYVSAVVQYNKVNGENAGHIIRNLVILNGEF